MKITLTVKAGPRWLAGASWLVSSAAAYWIGHTEGLAVGESIQLVVTTTYANVVAFIAGTRV